MPEVWVDADHWISQAKEHLREKGFVVVEKARLEALERLEEAVKNWYRASPFTFGPYQLEIVKALHGMEAME